MKYCDRLPLWTHSESWIMTWVKYKKYATETANFLFQVWLCIQKEQINETKRHRGRHCGILKYVQWISIYESEKWRWNKINIFWQLNSSEYWIWIFLTVVLTLQIHIKALGGVVICNHCSFCRNKPTLTVSGPWQFVFQKVIVCVLSRLKSLQRCQSKIMQRWSTRPR